MRISRELMKSLRDRRRRRRAVQSRISSRRRSRNWSGLEALEIRQYLDGAPGGIFALVPHGAGANGPPVLNCDVGSPCQLDLITQELPTGRRNEFGEFNVVVPPGTTVTPGPGLTLFEPFGPPNGNGEIP